MTAYEIIRLLGTYAVYYEIAAVIYYILLVVAGWKIFEKAGEKGWKALIPIYNIFVFFKIIDLSYTLIFAVVIFGALSGIFAKIDGMSFLAAGCSIIGICITVATRMLEIIKLARSFGKGIGYMIGFFFLPNVFTLILAFGRARYKRIR